MLLSSVIIIIFLASFALAYYIIPKIARVCKELRLFDLPDYRKVHQIPTPRMGGVAFLPIVIIVFAMSLVLLLRLGTDVDALWRETPIRFFLAYLAGAIMIYSIGLCDDIKSIGYKTKFVVQIIAALFLCISGLWITTLGHVFMIDRLPCWIGMPLTILVVVYITNAINLIDGIDGLASGLSCISLAVMAFLNIISHNLIWAFLAIAYLAVVLAFFFYNVFCKENKIFMGDAGSLTLGFTLSFLLLRFWQASPVWDPSLHNIGIVAFSSLVIPLLDVVRVVMSRIRDHRNPFLPDKNHIHHKFLRAGLSGRMTMVSILLISCFIIICNYLIASLNQTLIVILDISVYILLHLILNRFILRKERSTGNEWSREL